MKTEIKMTPEIYAARPYVARVVTGSFSGSFRFDTYAEAVQYVRQQVERNGVLSPCTANNWSNKGVRPSVHDTHVEGPDGIELSIEDIGVAVQCEGPLANWIILVEGEVIARRLTAPTQTKFWFEYMDGRELTLEEARAEYGELARQVHDLCCWPVQAAKLRKEMNALCAEIRAHDKKAR